MSYYMGDYGRFMPGRGDYYRGDPGFFSFLGKAVKGAVKIGAGLLGVGTPVGGAIGRQVPEAAGAITRTAGRVGGAIMRHPVLSAAGAAGVVGAIGGAVGERAALPGATGRGFHISRRTGKVVRNRHMRVTNVRALRRSLRRIGGFARIARRVLHFTHPRAARGRPHFRFRKKRAA